MASAARLRVIAGGLEPRVAFAAAPEVAPPDAMARWPRRTRVAVPGVLLAVLLSLVVHGAFIAWGFYRTAGEEALAEGGSHDLIVMEGVSVLLLDSTESSAADAALPEAAPVTEVATLAALVDTASAAHVTEVEVAATARDDVAAEVTPALPDAATNQVEPAPAKAVDVATAALSSDVAASVAVSDLVAAPGEGAPAAQIPDSRTPTAVTPDGARPVAEKASLPVDDDTAADAAVAEAPSAVPDSVVPAAIADDVVAAIEPIVPPMPAPRPLVVPAQPPPAPASSVTQAAKPAPPPAKPVKPTKPAKPATAASAPSVAEQAAQGPKPGNAGAGGVSADERGKASLSDYRSKVAARLRRARSYPAAARAENLTGTATVTFTITASGGVGRASLAKSSGHRILDQAALDMVARAAPFPPLPAGAGNSITITVPVRFDTN